MKTCKTCAIPAQKSVMHGSCAGYSGKERRIQPLRNCETWTPIDKTLTVLQALAYASSAGVHVTKPTMIHWCVARGIGKQIPDAPWGRWYIDSDKLKKLLQEE